MFCLASFWRHWLARKSLLKGAQAGPPIRDTIWQQIYHAKYVDTAEAWRLALKHPDPKASEYHQNLAQQGLALHYLDVRPQDRDYENAVEPLEQLAASAQPRFKAFGIAGLVVAYANLYYDEQAYIENQRLSAEDTDHAARTGAPHVDASQ